MKFYLYKKNRGGGGGGSFSHAEGGVKQRVEVVPTRELAVLAIMSGGGGGHNKINSHPLKMGGGGGCKMFYPVLSRGGGREQKVSHPHFSHFCLKVGFPKYENCII